MNTLTVSWRSRKIFHSHYLFIHANQTTRWTCREKSAPADVVKRIMTGNDFGDVRHGRALAVPGVKVVILPMWRWSIEQVPVRLERIPRPTRARDRPALCMASCTFIRVHVCAYPAWRWTRSLLGNERARAWLRRGRAGVHGRRVHTPVERGHSNIIDMAFWQKFGIRFYRTNKDFIAVEVWLIFFPFEHERISAKYKKVINM